MMPRSRRFSAAGWGRVFHNVSAEEQKEAEKADWGRKMKVLSDDIYRVMFELEDRLRREGQVRFGGRLAKELVDCLTSCISQAYSLQRRHLDLYKPTPDLRKGELEAFRKLDKSWADGEARP